MNKIVFREPKMDDVKSAVEMMNSLVKEEAYISVQKKLTLKDEKEYFKKILKDKKEKKRIDLFLDINGKVCGSASVFLIDQEGKKHIGEFGILLKKEARGKGLGEKLMRKTIQKAVKELKIKIVRLDVLADNKIATNLYRKVGFQKLGTIKKGINHYGKMLDYNEMIKYL
jgi:RimJ/RimL family protein N-acetyltransferase